MPNFEEIENAIAEVQQPRSRFQLERFVLGQHASQEMQYYQTLIELQDMINKYKLAQIKVKKMQAKILKLRNTGDEIDELSAQEKELSLTQLKLAMIGADREIAHLAEIYNTFEHKFSRQEIEQAQPNYWQARLTNHARATLMGGTSVDAAHIQAMEQAGILENFVQEVTDSKKELGL